MERYVFSNKTRAEVALTQLNQLIEWYGVASRADMKDIYGITPNERDQIFGWNDLSNAAIEFDVTIDQFVLVLPRAVRLD